MKDSRVWRILSWMSTRCDMQSLIVWMIAGTATAERETARREMRRWSELSAIVITTGGIFRLSAHEYRVKEVFRLAEQEKWRYHDARVQVKGRNIPYWQ